MAELPGDWKLKSDGIGNGRCFTFATFDGLKHVSQSIITPTMALEFQRSVLAQMIICGIIALLGPGLWVCRSCLPLGYSR